MTMTRRGFLKSLVGIAAAPAICKAENLMKIIVPDQSLMVSSGLYQHLLSSKHIDKTAVPSWFAADFDGDTNSFIGNTGTIGIWSCGTDTNTSVCSDSSLLIVRYPITGADDVLPLHEVQYALDVDRINELQMT